MATHCCPSMPCYICHPQLRSDTSNQPFRPSTEPLVVIESHSILGSTRKDITEIWSSGRVRVRVSAQGDTHG